MSAKHLLGCVFLAVFFSLGIQPSWGAKQNGKKATVFRDGSKAPLTFAAAEIRKSLQTAGYAVLEKSPADLPAEKATVQIVLTTADDKLISQHLKKEDGASVKRLGEQAYVIRKTSEKGTRTLWAIGADARGAMYAGLHLAEQIRLAKGIDAIAETQQSPHILRRGIKFNIPLDARTPSYDDSGDAAQQNYVQMWDFAFWEPFLDDLARHRFNSLTLWNPHPFPSLVKLPNFPDVALDDVCVTTLGSAKATTGRPGMAPAHIFKNLKVVKKMSIDEKITFWRRVMRHAKDRGIDIYFITWNVHVNSADGKYGISHSQTNTKTIAYLRECTSQLILTYPDLVGIGVTAGENMQNRKGEFSKEKWLWRAYGQGVMDAKKKQPDRKVRFIHRVWQTGVGQVIKEFGAKYPDSFELSFKYARAHMYSSTKPPFADKLCREMKPHKIKCWWNIRNDDLFNFRWGDPDYVREFLNNLPPGQTAGYHMGSDGYVWGREFTSVNPLNPRALEIQKHWYKFMLWGRLGYNPKLDRAFFVKVLSLRFPKAPATDLYDAWAATSKIVPQVNRFHWRNWDFMFAPEGCMDNRGFHSVNDFIKGRPMERSGILSVPEFVDRQLAKKTITGTTPIQVAQKLRKHAEDALKLIEKIRKKLPVKDSAYRSMSLMELRKTLADIEAMAHLGNYYSAKILGAVELDAARKSKDDQRKEAAIEHLSKAVKHWESYAKVASSQYRPQLLARTRRLDWTKTLDDVKRDVEIARSAKSK